MVLSSLTVILASGFWLILLIGCLLFAVIAIKKRAQVDDLEQIVDTQRTHIQRLMKSIAESPGPAESPIELDNVPEDNAADKQTIAKLTEMIEVQQAKADKELTQARQKAAVLQAKVVELEGAVAVAPDTASTNAISTNTTSTNTTANTIDSGEHELLKQQLVQAEEGRVKATKLLADAQATAKSLRQENEILDRQLQALSETAELGDADTMREIIVNFTEESRELLLTIQALETEQVELKQRLADNESGEKGTTGAVMGLKRKLAQAEQDLLDLQGEYDLLRAGKSATV